MKIKLVSKNYSHNRGMIVTSNIQKYSNESNVQILKYTLIPPVFSVKELTIESESAKEISRGILSFDFPIDFSSVLHFQELFEITCKTTGKGKSVLIISF